MPRPCKQRRVCRLPGCRRFGSTEPENTRRPEIEMTVDEYEAIRLIDLLGLSQEECAARMDVARTTAQAIYNSARLKLAQFLVYEGDLHIGGGEYVVCKGREENCPCENCVNENDRIKEDNIMRIAVTYQAGQASNQTK